MTLLVLGAQVVPRKGRGGAPYKVSFSMTDMEELLVELSKAVGLGQVCGWTAGGAGHNQNLFSVATLTAELGYCVAIERKVMDFFFKGEIWFSGSVGDNRAALLSLSTTLARLRLLSRLTLYIIILATSLWIVCALCTLTTCSLA